MVYNPGQFSVVFPLVKRPPTWLLLGGPADADEAQTAVKQWPDIKVLGVEPSKAMYEYQLAHDWPGSLLLQCALGSSVGQGQIHISGDTPRCSSFVADHPGELHTVDITTLDVLDEIHGPFENAILWLDVEGSEYEALLGARKLFDRGAIAMVNVECLVRLQELFVPIEKFLADYKFHLVHTWNIQHNFVSDRIYMPAN